MIYILVEIELRVLNFNTEQIYYQMWKDNY